MKGDPNCTTCGGSGVEETYGGHGTVIEVECTMSDISEARQKVERAVAMLNADGDDLRDCDALLVKMQDAEIVLTLALNHLDRALADQSPQQQQ